MRFPLLLDIFRDKSIIGINANDLQVEYKVKLKALVLISMAVLLLPIACRKTEKGTGFASDGTKKLQVVVTFNALKEIVNCIGGEHVSVFTMIPDGVEPHNFEPKAKDMMILSKADVFVYNGLGLESWVPGALTAAGNKKMIVVDSSVGVTPIDQNGVDPHIWLSLKCAEIQAGNCVKALVSADPQHADYYAQKGVEYRLDLETLYGQYTEKFASVSKRTIVTGHAAFAYLCRDFGLEQNSVEDVFASGEPNAQRLIELINYARVNKVKTIFMESLISPAVSKTLADEVGAEVRTIYTLESQEDGKTGLVRMRENLEAIYQSLAE